MKICFSCFFATFPSPEPFFRLSVPLTFLFSGLFCLSQADSYPFLPYGLEEFPNGHSDLYHAARKLWVLFLCQPSHFIPYILQNCVGPCQMCQVADLCFISDIFMMRIVTKPFRSLGASDVHSCSCLTGNVDVEPLMIRRAFKWPKHKMTSTLLVGGQ